MTPQENEMLTRVGPGTPGGEMLRRYWWPVWFSQDVTSKPMPVRLLGESFVLFRDGQGRVGMLDQACPIAAPRSNSAVAKRGGCAAATMAGCSMPRANVSKCRPSRRRASSTKK